MFFIHRQRDVAFAGYGVTLAKLIGELPEDFPAVHRWLDGLAARPAYEEALRGGFAG